MIFMGHIMTKQFISDVIPKTDIYKWGKNENILISAGTGSGKTTFIETSLYDVCSDFNNKILILSNRKSVERFRSRNGKEWADKSDEEICVAIIIKNVAEINAKNEWFDENTENTGDW